MQKSGEYHRDLQNRKRDKLDTVLVSAMDVVADDESGEACSQYAVDVIVEILCVTLFDVVLS
jgi:hypothetical protein